MDLVAISSTKESHHLNPDLTMTCEFKGHPIKGVTWSATEGIDPPFPVTILSDADPDFTITNSRTACMLTSTLHVADYPLHVQPNINNLTFICTAEYYQKTAIESHFTIVRK